MKAPRYFLLLNSPFTKQGSKGLIFDCLPICHTPYYQWLLQPHTSFCLQFQILILFLTLVESSHWPVFSLWYPTPVITHRIHCVCNDVITWLSHLTWHTSSFEQFYKVMILAHFNMPLLSDLWPILNIKLILEFGRTSDVTFLVLLFFQSFMHILELKSSRQIFVINIFFVESP